MFTLLGSVTHLFGLSKNGVDPTFDSHRTSATGNTSKSKGCLWTQARTNVLRLQPESLSDFAINEVLVTPLDPIHAPLERSDLKLRIIRLSCFFRSLKVFSGEEVWNFGRNHVSFIQARMQRRDNFVKEDVN